MADATLIVNGSTPIHLKLDNVYRIGRGEGYEIHIADQSVDVAHGSAAILRPGVVRFSALCGKIFVNGEEKSLTDVGKEDAFNGKDVKLRFGNVEAILEFKDDIDGVRSFMSFSTNSWQWSYFQLNTGSGFGECVQDKNDLTGDSFEIPETQPPPEDTSVNVTADSFYIPETQAVIPNRPSAGGNVSLGEDFMIPETQDVPLMVHNETTRCSDGSSSGSGSHIRICTQDFNDDAIDDFDSSLILGHPLMPLSPPKAEKRVENPEATHENLEASELEMTALNWSVSNSKCTALNSTNHQNEGHSGLEACLTPTLTGLSQDIHTPDLLDSVLCGGNKSYARQEEPAIPTTDLIDSSPDDARLSGSRSNASTPQLCGVKHLVVATIETPRPTPDEKEDNANREPNQDLIATQRFPGRKLIESDEVDEPEPNQDFIATQRFPGRKFIESDEQVEPNQDFIATQRFPGTNLGESDKEDQPTQANNMFKEPNQDFIATQRFPGLDLRESDDEDQPNQDFVPTQLFIPAPQGGNNQKSPECSNKNVSLNQDFIETQVFPTRGSAIQDKENIGSDDVSLKEDSSKTFQGLEPPYDEIDEVLNEMIAGTAMSPVDPREEQIKYFKPCVIKDKNHDLKVGDKSSTKPLDNYSLFEQVSQIEGVFKDVSNQSRWRNEPTNEVSRKRVARSVSPQATRMLKSNILKTSSTASKASSEQEVEDVPKRRSRARSKAISEELNDITKIVQERGQGDGTNVPKNRSRATSKAKSSEPEAKDVPKRRSGGRSKAISEKVQEPSEGVGTNVPKSRARAKSKAKSTEPEVKDVSRSRSRGKSKAKSSEPEVKDVPKGRSRAKSKAKSTEPEVKDVSRSRSRGKSKAESSEPEVKDVPKGRSRAKSKAKSTEPEVKDVSRSRSRGKSKAKSSEPEVKDVPKRRSIAKSKAKSTEPEVKDVPKSRSRSKSKAKSSEPEVKNVPKRRSGGRSKAISEKVQEPSEADGTNVPKSRSRAGSRAKSQARSKAGVEESVKVAPPKRRNARSSSAKKSLDRSEAPSEAASTQTTLNNPNEISSEDGAKNKSRSTKGGARKGSAVPSSNKEEALADKKPKRGKAASKPEEPVAEKSNTLLKSTSEPLEASPAYNELSSTIRLDGKIKIVFSMCDRKPLERVLKSLQKVIEVTEDPLNCDLVIMDKGDRTYKFLVGVASNKPILSSSWLHSVRSSSCITVKEDHLFQDEKFEEKFKFRPISILESPRLLNGLTFFLRDGIQPNVKEMQGKYWKKALKFNLLIFFSKTAILECAGGIALLKRPPLSTIGEIFVVTTPQDLTSKNIMRDFETVHFILPEGIMQALLQHKQELLKDFPIKFKN
ncbi:hypothetical protein KR074_008796 [Drosophila pseudoananassae]|nr:hypothetical protein KR074_008796 [Drosophila pseudoananassae]